MGRHNPAEPEGLRCRDQLQWPGSQAASKARESFSLGDSFQATGLAGTGVGALETFRSLANRPIAPAEIRPMSVRRRSPLHCPVWAIPASWPKAERMGKSPAR